MARKHKLSALLDERSPERGEKKIIPPAKSAEIERIKELVYKSPDIREDMVADLRTRVLGGVYKVGTEQVAEKLMQHGAYILGARRGNDCHSV